MRTISILISSLVLVCLASATFAQTPDPAIKTTQVFGKVTEINASSGQITIKTAAGSVVVASITEKTTYQRMPPGETDRAKAEQTSLTEITVGDGLVARGFVAADQKSVPAQQIIVVSQSEIAKKNAAEKMAWSRGAKGIVKSVNPSTKEVTVGSSAITGAPQSITVAVEKAKIRQYPPGTIPKYESAKPAHFEEIKVGDQFNAKGEKSADGMHLDAQEVLFGTFKIAGGTVTEIDVANNTVKINDLTTKKPLTIVFKPESIIRRLPQGAAMMFGGMAGAGGPGGPGGAGPGAGRPQGEGQGQAAQGQGQRPQGPGPGGPGGPGRMGGGGTMADMLERWPTITINELKVGDTVLMSSLPGADPTQLTAIQLVTGAETLLAMAAARQQQGGQGRQGGGGVDQNGSFGGMFGGLSGP